MDIVANTYRKCSIKDPERLKRGCAERVIVNSAVSRLPRNFDEFFQNSDNKTRLIELIGEVLIQSREEVLNIRLTNCITLWMVYAS